MEDSLDDIRYKARSYWNNYGNALSTHYDYMKYIRNNLMKKGLYLYATASSDEDYFDRTIEKRDVYPLIVFSLVKEDGSLPTSQEITNIMNTLEIIRPINIHYAFVIPTRILLDIICTATYPISRMKTEEEIKKTVREVIEKYFSDNYKNIVYNEHFDYFAFYKYLMMATNAESIIVKVVPQLYFSKDILELLDNQSIMHPQKTLKVYTGGNIYYEKVTEDRYKLNMWLVEYNDGNILERQLYGVIYLIGGVKWLNIYASGIGETIFNAPLINDTKIDRLIVNENFLRNYFNKSDKMYIKFETEGMVIRNDSSLYIPNFTVVILNDVRVIPNIRK